jgi:seryl-tRNA synthetase
MPPTGKDTGQFCSQHIEAVQELTRLDTTQKEMQKSLDSNWLRTNESSKDLAHLKGFYEGSVPALQGDTRKVKDDLEAHIESSTIYNTQLRIVTNQMEGIVKEAQTFATKEGLRNCYLWVKAGFVAWGLTILVFAAYLLLAKLGVKTP